MMTIQKNSTSNEANDVNSNFSTFLSSNDIEIPLIQRDYVQGSNKQSEKRDAFIDSLFTAILDPEQPCELDFIYGTYDHGAFMPLDGQQRLTTLYLLHWFLSNKCRLEKASEFSAINNSYLDTKSFNYKTRRSSTAFCEKLKSFKPSELSTIISEDIKGQTWFSENWKQDPSVIAMLEMLDALNEKYLSLENPDVVQMYERLVNTEAINFDHLDMGTYKLTDSLYVKMNARGKQLTVFENWKAKFIQYLEDYYDIQEYSTPADDRKEDFNKIKNYFTHSIEHEWTDLFWTYAVNDYKIRLAEYNKLTEDEKMTKPEPSGPLIDSYFLNFYYYIYRIQFFLTKNEEGDEDDNVDKPINGTEASRKLLFKNKECLEFLYSSLDLFVEISINNNRDIKHFFNELFYLIGQKVDGSVRLFSSNNVDLFELTISNKASVDEQILLFCVIKYCIKNKCYTVTDELKKYARVCRNMLESITQRLTKDMKMHSNVRFSHLPKYIETIDNLCSVKNVVMLSSFKAGMGDVNSVFSWMQYYNNKDIFNIEDSSYIHGSLYAFDLEISPSIIKNALIAFKNATDLERTRILVCFNYGGTNFGGCAHGNRLFFGYRDRWDVLFRFKEEAGLLKKSFMAFAKEFDKRPNIGDIIENKLNELDGKDCFEYYFLKYDAFANSSIRWVMDSTNDSKNADGHHFFAKVSDFDIITLPRFSSNPLLGYHTEPYSCAVAQSIRIKYPDIYAHMDYTGKDKNKAKITFDDKNLQLLCTNEGWKVLFNYNSDNITTNKIPLARLKVLSKLCLHNGKGKHYIFIGVKNRIDSAIYFIKVLYDK